MRSVLRTLSISVLGLSVVVPCVRSQTGPAPKFEVATIKLSKDPTGSVSGIRTGHGELSAQNVTLKRCIIGAYGIGPHQIIGGPDWMSSTRFDIEAKGDPSIDSDDVLMDMLRRLLADRFDLQLHSDKTTMGAYSLEVAKNGPTLKLSANGEAITSSSSSNTLKTLRADHVNMTSLAKVLARETSLPIVDNTGLTGSYSFALRWTPDNARQPDSKTEDYGSLPDAIREQLGLQLRVTTLPVESLIIDHVTAPTSN